MEWAPWVGQVADTGAGQRGPAIVAAGRVRKSGRLPVRDGVVTERRVR